MKLPKTKFTSIGIFVLIVIAILFALLRGGEKNTTLNKTNSHSQEKVLKKFLESSDNELKEIAKNKQKPLPPLTALEKIENSFQKGEIDVNKYLKLKALAIFKPEDLPSNFQSQTHKNGEGDMLLTEIQEYQNQLDNQTKKMLLPFILPPEEEGSFFNPKTNRDAILNKIKQSL